MGRPLRKDVLGTDAINTYVGAATGVKVEIHDGSLRTDGVILKQRGAKTFQCCRVGDLADSTKFLPYTLVSGTPASNGGERVNLAKITKRVATDWSGNKYTWTLENDSSNDYIVLTPIS